MGPPLFRPSSAQRAVWLGARSARSPEADKWPHTWAHAVGARSKGGMGVMVSGARAQCSSSWHRGANDKTHTL